MKGYGQFCPVAKAAEILSERWTALIIRELLCGQQSFNNLRRGLPLISPSLLSTRLKTLEHHGVIERQKTTEGILYSLTPSGEELRPIIMELGVWGQRWVRSDMSKTDLDPSLLMWDMHRHINSDFFPDKRTVIKFEFSQCPAKMRDWWLVIDAGEVDVCLKSPGHDIDLQIQCSLKTMSHIWMGDMTVTQAHRGKLLNVIGNSALKLGMQEWLGLSSFANVKPATE